MLCFVVVLAAAASAAQQPPRVPAAGLETPWDVRTILDHIVNDTQQLRAVVTRMSPQQWYDKKGAPSTYIVQWQTAQRQLNDVVYTAGQLSQKTESLSLAL